ncbi:hypothetical protein, partial [Henriciella pelagia]|uniref:hypothetical protein n=1 Tax=Henriciella pelagia TaxID=1977912 RepID=UPI003519D26E
ADCQRPLLRRGIASRLHGGLGVQEPAILGGLHYRADQVFVSINFCFLKMLVTREYAKRFVAIFAFKLDRPRFNEPIFFKF